MKKTYIIPEALVVTLSSCSIIAESLNVSDGSTTTLPNNSNSEIHGKDAEVKGSTNVWDEEW